MAGAEQPWLIGRIDLPFIISTKVQKANVKERVENLALQKSAKLAH